MGSYGQDKLKSAYNQLKRFRTGMMPRTTMNEDEVAELCNILLLIADIRNKDFETRKYLGGIK